MTVYNHGRVSPFGNLRIKACVPLPEAYRSLLRPSSPDVAKASIDCCNWFMQTNLFLGVYFTHFSNTILDLDFQRTKLFYYFCALFSAFPLIFLLRAYRNLKMVGPDGFEPSTLRLSSACSNQLSYEPNGK